MKQKIGNLLCAIGKALGAVCLEKEESIEESQLVSYGTININLMSSILLDKLEDMNCTGEIYLPDNDCKTYTKNSVSDHYSLVEISGITYLPEEHDCQNFVNPPVNH